MAEFTQKFSEKYYGFLYHYYRAEVYRETSWRSRLDVTTNWAIVITATLLSFVFSTSGISHVVIIINYLIVWFFLYIEARRFRYYSLVRERVKIFEKHILSPMFNLENDEDDSETWLREISDKLATPRVRMSRIESLSWRLRRNYVFIIPLIFAVWVYKVIISPVGVLNLNHFFYNARIGFIPGVFVFIFMIVTVGASVFVAFYISRKHGGNDLP